MAAPIENCIGSLPPIKHSPPAEHSGIFLSHKQEKRVDAGTEDAYKIPQYLLLPNTCIYGLNFIII